MTQMIFSVKLKGADTLYEPLVDLQDEETDLQGGGSSYHASGQHREVGADTKLKIYMCCEAITGTNWEFTVKRTDTDPEVTVYTANGYTGEPLESRDGESIKRFSERKVTVTIE